MTEQQKSKEILTDFDNNKEHAAKAVLLVIKNIEGQKWEFPELAHLFARNKEFYESVLEIIKNS